MEDMIRTWVADVTPLLDADIYRTYYNSMPDFRKTKADQLRFHKDKALSIGAWYLFERMKHAYGLCHAPVFNLSHSEKYVLCSVEDSRSPDVKVGCDIEYLKELRPGVARRFFCEKETSYIEGRLTEEEQADAFYRYWVLKESFMKATRLGMGLDMRSFEIRVDDGDQPILIRKPEEIPGEYHYKEYMAEGLQAKIAVCSTSCDFDEIKKVEFGTGVF